LADDGVERVHLKVERPAVKKSLYVCCSTVIFGVRSYSETVIVPVLKSVVRKRIVKNVIDSEQ
jgi:hypothetical protein